MMLYLQNFISEPYNYQQWKHKQLPFFSLYQSNFIRYYTSHFKIISSTDVKKWVLIHTVDFFIVWICTQNLTQDFIRFQIHYFHFQISILLNHLIYDGMIFHIPTQKYFKNRLEARKYFGSGLFNRLVKHTTDFIFTNDSTFATNGNTVYTNPQKISGNG